MFLLLRAYNLRLFSLQTLKNMINIWPLPKFFRPPGWVGLATSLLVSRNQIVE